MCEGLYKAKIGSKRTKLKNNINVVFNAVVFLKYIYRKCGFFIVSNKK